MFRSILLAIASIVGLGTGWALSTTLPRVAPIQGINMLPYASRNFDINFQGDQRAAVVCIGGGNSLLGLYVFDQHGNCLAHEDLAPPRPFREPSVTYYPDDLGVVWYPMEKALQSVEVVNFGNLPNRCELAPK